MLAIAFALAIAGAAPADGPLSATCVVTDFKVEVEDRPPTVLERPQNITYFTPYFKANATVKLTTPEAESYTLGFIQQVDVADIRMEYAKAHTKWVMPRLPIRDGSGSPWYDVPTSARGPQAVPAGQKDAVASVAMDDNLTTTITWGEPLPPKGDAGQATHTLRRVERDQQFTVWLALMRDSDKHIDVLKKVSWRMQVDLDVDCSRPIGSRCKVKALPHQAPTVIDAPGATIPERILKGGAANADQQFWLHPADAEPIRLR